MTRELEMEKPAKRMGRPTIPPEEVKTQSLKITFDAMQILKIACSYSSESISEYASRVITETGRKDIARLQDAFNASAAGAALLGKSKPKPKGGKP
jgi:hypothetical protein